MKEDDAVQMFREARALYHEERYEQALVLFERIAREHPDNTGMWHAHAWCLARMDRHDEARELCRRLQKAGDDRVAEIVAYLEANKSAPDRAERPKNPETVVQGESNLPPLREDAPEPVRSEGPRTWRAFSAGRGERAPGGIRCARITLIAIAGVGILALVFSFLMSAMVLQQNSAAGEVPGLRIALITLGLTVELLVTCLASLAWQQLLAGKIAIAVVVACMLLFVFPLGTAASMLIFLGLFDRDSSTWLRRAAARGGI